MDELERLNDALDRLEKSNQNNVIKGIVIALVPTLLTTIIGFIIAGALLQQEVKTHSEFIKSIDYTYVNENDFIRVLKTIDYNFNVLNKNEEHVMGVKDNYKSK